MPTSRQRTRNTTNVSTGCRISICAAEKRRGPLNTARMLGTYMPNSGAQPLTPSKNAGRGPSPHQGAAITVFPAVHVQRCELIHEVPDLHVCGMEKCKSRMELERCKSRMDQLTSRRRKKGIALNTESLARTKEAVTRVAQCGIVITAPEIGET